MANGKTNWCCLGNGIVRGGELLKSAPSACYQDGPIDILAELVEMNNEVKPMFTSRSPQPRNESINEQT